SRGCPKRNHPLSGGGGDLTPRTSERRTSPASRTSRRPSRLAVALSVALVLTSFLQGASSAASFLFSDGFESGNLSSWTGSSQMAVQQSVVESGSWAARATSTG